MSSYVVFGLFLAGIIVVVSACGLADITKEVVMLDEREETPGAHRRVVPCWADGESDRAARSSNMILTYLDPMGEILEFPVHDGWEPHEVWTTIVATTQRIYVHQGIDEVAKRQAQILADHTEREAAL